MWDSAIWYSPLVHAPFFTCLSVVVFSFFLCVCVCVLLLLFFSFFPFIIPELPCRLSFFPQPRLQFGGCRVRIVHLGF